MCSIVTFKTGFLMYSRYRVTGSSANKQSNTNARLANSSSYKPSRMHCNKHLLAILYYGHLIIGKHVTKTYLKVQCPLPSTWWINWLHSTYIHDIIRGYTMEINKCMHSSIHSCILHRFLWQHLMVWKSKTDCVPSTVCSISQNWCNSFHFLVNQVHN